MHTHRGKPFYLPDVHEGKVGGVCRSNCYSRGIAERATRSVQRLKSVDNVTDAKLFDNYGVQRPGRALYLKATGEI